MLESEAGQARGDGISAEWVPRGGAEPTESKLWSRWLGQWRIVRRARALEPRMPWFDTSILISGKYLKFSVPLFLGVQNEDSNNSYLRGS